MRRTFGGCFWNTFVEFYVEVDVRCALAEFFVGTVENGELQWIRARRSAPLAFASSAAAAADSIMYQTEQ